MNVYIKFARIRVIFHCWSNDLTGTGEQCQPFQTIQRAVDEAAKYNFNKKTITIFVGDGIYEEELSIEGISGTLYLQSLSQKAAQTTVISRCGIRINNNHNEIWLQHLTLHCTSPTEEITAFIQIGSTTCRILSTNILKLPIERRVFMNSTPNYGFKEEVKICAIDAIDRELKRIENLIRCYNNSTCNCAGKVDKAEFEQHLADMEVHRELFESKVDKRDGYSLISQECLKQICQNKEGLHLLEQYFQKLQERSDWLETELANKVNIQEPEEYDLEMLEGFIPRNEGHYENNYSIDAFSRVTVHLAAMTADGKDSIGFGRIAVAQLPEGFRPKKEVVVPVYLHSLTPRRAYPAGMAIGTDGSIEIGSYNAESAGVIFGEASFLAAQ